MVSWQGENVTRADKKINLAETTRNPAPLFTSQLLFSFRHWGLGGRGVTERAETCTAHLGRGGGIF